jgi:polyhydroxyalkanoate synthesis repressor PhaR
MTDTIVLKKYANRRLYDTTRSAYVTLDEVAEMVRKGRAVRAVDAQTKEDVTAFVLTQIVLEEARKKNALLPAPLLHMIIRYGDNVLVDFFDKYLEQIVRNYLEYKSSVDEQFRKWLDFGADMSELAQKSMAGITPFSTIFKPKPESRKKEQGKEDKK